MGLLHTFKLFNLFEREREKEREGEEVREKDTSKEKRWENGRMGIQVPSTQLIKLTLHSIHTPYPAPSSISTSTDLSVLWNTLIFMVRQ